MIETRIEKNIITSCYCFPWNKPENWFRGDYHDCIDFWITKIEYPSHYFHPIKNQKLLLLDDIRGLFVRSIVCKFDIIARFGNGINSLLTNYVQRFNLH